MKKSFFLSILAVGALVACSKSEVVDTKFDQAIGFETYLGRDAQTKGEVITTADLTKVAVYGYYTGTTKWVAGTAANLWDPMTLACNNGVCTVATEDVRYWTNDTDYYTFLAYAPVDNTNLAAPTDATDPVLSYTVDTDFSKHVDVLVAEPQIDRTKNVYGENTNMNGNVPLQLNHKLARLTVKATADNDPFTFHIKEISIKGNFNKTGTISLSDPAEWDTEAVEETYYFVPTNETVATSENGLPASTDYATVEGGKGYMMMIPVDADTHQAKLTVKYTTYDANANVESRVYTQTFDITNDFVMGSAYAITLAFENTATTINFSVDVTDWGNESNTTFNPAN